MHDLEWLQQQRSAKGPVDGMGGAVKILVGTVIGLANLVTEVTAEIPPDRGLGSMFGNTQPYDLSLDADLPDLSTPHCGVVAFDHRTHAQMFCQSERNVEDILRPVGTSRIGDCTELNGPSGLLTEAETTTWAKSWSVVSKRT